MALSEEQNNQNVNEENDWEKFLKFFAEEIGERQFQVFGNVLQFDNKKNSTITIKAPRDFHRDWLLDKHGKAFESSFYRAYPDSFDYKIIVNKKPAKSPASNKNKETPAASENKQDVKKVFPFAKNRHLNPAYTFENFIVGQSNNYAYSAARAVAEKPAEGYNPLFIHGQVGLGKTHLLQAIGHKVNSTWEQASVKYVSAEKFTNQIIQAIQDNNPKEFQYRYRSTDLLLVDDVQFFGKTERAQEEFFHTFNELYESGKGIALCSDRPPQEISLLEERLRNRFEMGFIVDIQPPDYETRVAILQNKANQAGIALPNEVIRTIAENITSNIRALEGSLNQLTMMTSFTDQEITPEMVKSQLSNFLQSYDELNTEVVSIDEIQETVAEHFNISIADLKSQKRSKAIARPRQLGMYLARELTDQSYADIGEAFGGRDHSTVIHGTKKIKKEVEDEQNTKTDAHINKIKSSL